MLLSQTPEDEFSLHIGVKPDWRKDNNHNLSHWRYVVEMCVILDSNSMHTLMELKSFCGLVMLKNKDANALFPEHGD